MFNQISRLKNEDGSNVLKFQDRSKMLENIDTIFKGLNTSSEIIPEYNLNLLNLPKLDIEEHTSPKLTESALQLESLNVKVEET
jgi:hypothetical protein